MASKAVMRDVGRVLDLPYNFCDRLSKLIPVEQGKPLSLDRGAAKQEPQTRRDDGRRRRGERCANCSILAEPLEGLTRNVGMHAGGVLIAPGKLTDFCPLYVADGGEASPVSQFDKDDVEKVGLVKFDFLGLRNLTIIELAVDYVERLTGEQPDLDALAFDDPAAYQILKDANTTAIFQVESDGMKKLLKKLAPDRFEDIIAVLALYRPGPLGSGMVDDFILRKKGQQKIDYFHDDLKACLAPTYGVIVYQEQVMQISQIIGGYTLGGADMLRRAMGKKKADEMAKHREIDRARARRRRATIRRLADAAVRPDGRSSPSTASTSRTPPPTPWSPTTPPGSRRTTARPSWPPPCRPTWTTPTQSRSSTKTRVANELKVLPPDVNASDYRFVPDRPRAIRYGLGAVKGTGEQAVRAIIAARRRRGRSRICSTSASASTSAWSTAASSRRWCAPAPSMRSTTTAPTSSPACRLAMEAAEQIAANAMQGGLFDVLPDGGGADGRVRTRARGGPSASSSRKRRRRSASSSPATPSTASGAKCRASCGARWRSSNPHASRSPWPAW